MPSHQRWRAAVFSSGVIGLSPLGVIVCPTRMFPVFNIRTNVKRFAGPHSRLRKASSPDVSGYRV